MQREDAKRGLGLGLAILSSVVVLKVSLKTSAKDSLPAWVGNTMVGAVNIHDDWCSQYGHTSACSLIRRSARFWGGAYKEAGV